MPQLAIPLRVIILGQHQSPAIEKVLFLLGRMEVKKRLEKFLEGTVT
jgi:glutamyl-tRNA synthetase